MPLHSIWQHQNPALPFDEDAMAAQMDSDDENAVLAALGRSLRNQMMQDAAPVTPVPHTRKSPPGEAPPGGQP